LLLTTRRRWLFGEQAVPIERHSMLSNSHTVALLTPAARVTWLCHPKPDSAAIFADLLGDTAAGHFTISPERGGLPLGQRYRPGVQWEVISDGHSDSARATIDLNACGGTAWLELRLGTNNMEPPRVEFTERQIVAETAWRDWSDRLKLPSVARDHVRRSALT